MNTPQFRKVFVPVSVDVELPKESSKCGIIRNGKFDHAYFVFYNNGKNYTFDSVKQGLSMKQSEITHWLKEMGGYFLTEDEYDVFSNPHKIDSTQKPELFNISSL